MVKRRRFVAGLGALGVSIGTVITVGTVDRSVAPEGDLRVIVAAALTVRRGNNVPPDGSVNRVDGVDLVNLDRTTDGRVSDDRLDFGDFDANDVPIAGANDGVNDDLVINVATGLRPGGSGQTAEELIEIANDGHETAAGIGIKYSTYGRAVTEAGDFTEQQVQDIYQFIADDDGVDDLDSPVRISPDPNTAGSGPDNQFALAPGETAQVDVENNNQAYTAELRSAADVTDDPWSGGSDAIALLNEINVLADTDD